MLKPFLTAAFLALMPAAAMAADGHGHAAKGPHGGLIQDVAGVEAELVVGAGTVAIYLSDHGTRAVSPDGVQGSLLLTQGTTRVGTITLKPAGDRLEGMGEVPDGADIVLSLRTTDGKTGQAKYELGGHSH